MFRYASNTSCGSYGMRPKANKGQRTHTITIAYAEASSPCLSQVSLSSRESTSTSSSSSLASLSIPSVTDSAQAHLDQVEKDKAKEQFFGYYPTWLDTSMHEGPQLKALEYLHEYNIFQLFNFLITHVLVNAPDDPVSFLVSLIDKCIRYRDGEGEPPLVFEEGHVTSVYVALDPLLDGCITYSQYLVGMKTLGLADFNVLPNELESNREVTKEKFVTEATQALTMQLDKMLGKKPKDIFEIELHCTDLASKQDSSGN